jgi:hypothetical protein
MKAIAEKTETIRVTEETTDSVYKPVIELVRRQKAAGNYYHLKFDDKGYVIIDEDTPQDVIDWLMEG